MKGDRTSLLHIKFYSGYIVIPISSLPFAGKNIYYMFKVKEDVSSDRDRVFGAYSGHLKL